MKKKLYALSGVFLIVLVVAGLWASKAGGFTEQDPEDPTTKTFNGVSMKDMTLSADRIVIGKCTGTQSQWVDGRRLVTLATVEVAETLKGPETGSVIVEVPGGYGNRGKFQLAMTYPGAPTFGSNEDVALFLVPANEVANTYAVMNTPEGKFSVVKDTDGEPVVARVPMKVAAPKVTGLASGNPQTMKLSEFKAMIEGYLK
jgi:hypothetical protein